MEHRFRRTALAIGLLWAATACKPQAPMAEPSASGATVATSAAAVTPDPRSSGADDNLNAVAWVQTSSEYAALTTGIYRAAADHLDAALKEPNWDALVPGERANAAGDLPPAAILDVDETVLDNSPYQARLVLDGAEYNEVTWDQWVAEKKAKPVPGVVEFAKAANAKGVTLLYISNRAEHLQAATLENLRAAGLPVKDESVFLGLGTVVEGCEQDGSEKNCRRQWAGRHYRVLMQFGDQLGDFVQVVANTPAGRDDLLAEYDDWFGERWWMLPNPTYGSWEPALFNNDWQQPRNARRDAKRAMLEPMR